MRFPLTAFHSDRRYWPYIAGMVLAIAAAACIVIFVRPSRYTLFAGQGIDDTTQMLEVASTAVNLRPVAGGHPTNHRVINVSFPSTVLLNRSYDVELTFDTWETTRTPLGMAGSFIDTDVVRDGYVIRRWSTQFPGGGVTLTSTVFSISPESYRERPSGEPLPAKFRWTITPNRLGDHQLELDLAQLLKQDSEDDRVTNRIILNSKGFAVAVDEIVVPIRVVTVWGLSERQFALLKLALMGCVGGATYPIVITLIRRWTGIKDSDA